jgi:hypothetical protein
MNNLTELLEKVIESKEIKLLFLRDDLKRAMDRKYSEPPQKPKAVSKKYKVTIIVESIEELV